MGQRHTAAQYEGSGTLFAAGRIQLNGTTLSLTVISPPVGQKEDITAYRLAAGLYQVNLGSFRGPQGVVIPSATVGSSAVTGGGAGQGALIVPMSCAIGAGSFATGTDNYGFVIGVTSGNTYVDADVWFTAHGF